MNQRIPDGEDEPGSGKPGTAKPGTAKPGTAKPGTAKPGTAYLCSGTISRKESQLYAGWQVRGTLFFRVNSSTFCLHISCIFLILLQAQCHLRANISF